MSMKKIFRALFPLPVRSLSRLFGSTQGKTLFPLCLGKAQTNSPFAHHRLFRLFGLTLLALTLGARVYSFEKHKKLDTTMNKETRIQELTELQRRVTQEEGTEPPFQNEYWNEKREGIYVDIVSGKALFSSKDKFDSGCGWPSFTKPLEEKNIESKTDYKLMYPRKEVHSTDGTHLGHVFNDGPKEKGGLRYCINSASLKFIPKEEMIQQGYEKEYKEFFGK